MYIIKLALHDKITKTTVLNKVANSSALPAIATDNLYNLLFLRVYYPDIYTLLCISQPVTYVLAIEKYNYCAI